MSTLYLALLGPPELRHGEHVLTFPTRKALALIVYLAVEGGVHRRQRLSEFFWPELDAEHGRAALRATLQQLRLGLAHDEGSEHLSHLRIERDTLAIDTSDLILDVHQLHAVWKKSQHLNQSNSSAALEVRNAFFEVTQLVRGAFLAGLTLRDGAAFDDWMRYQRDCTQRRLHFVYEQLTHLLIEAGEQEQALEIATRWIAFDPLNEHAYQHLMRLHVTQGDRAAALRVYQVCCHLLASELRMEPTSETIALAEQIRTSVSVARREHVNTRGGSLVQPPLEVPLVGRSREFRTLIQRYQQAVQGHAQAVLVEGEAGIGKTRLVNDVLVWARSQGAIVWQVHAYETRGNLPYQPLIDILRSPLAQESDIATLIAMFRLTELSRLFPELYERVPGLAAPAGDEGARLRLFEAVANVVHALRHGKPLVLFVDDLQWADSATLDLLLYLFRCWNVQTQPILLLCSIRTPQTAAPLLSWQTSMRRTEALTRLDLSPITQPDTLHLLESLQRATHTSSDEQTEGSVLLQVSHWLYRETEGHPFYLLETLKTLLEQRMLTSYVGEHSQHVVDFTAIIGNEGAMRRVIPTTVSELITTRLHQLSQYAQIFLLACAVLGMHQRFKHVCWVAGLTEDQGLGVLDEVVAAAMLREEEHEDRRQEIFYHFMHDIVREVIYSEATVARLRVYHRRALEVLQKEETPAAELARHAHACGEEALAFSYSLKAGDEAMAVFDTTDAQTFYLQARMLVESSLIITATEIERLFAHLARALEAQEKWDAAKEALLDLLTTAQRMQNHHLVVIAHIRLATFAIQTNDISDARTQLEKALVLAEGMSDTQTQAELLWNLAQFHAVYGEARVSVLYAEQAVALAQEENSPELLANCCAALGVAYLHSGRFSEAISFAEQGHKVIHLLIQQTEKIEPLTTNIWAGTTLFPKTSYTAIDAFCLVVILLGQVNMGQAITVLPEAEAALTQAYVNKDAITIALLAVNLNHAYMEMGNYERARTTIVDAQDQTTLTQQLPLLYLWTTLGHTEVLLRRWSEAEVALYQSDKIARQYFPRWRGVIVPWQCALAVLQKDWKQAEDLALLAQEIRGEIEIPLVFQDFMRWYETEALLRSGNTKLARADIAQFALLVGENRRHRIVLLRMQAVLAEYDSDLTQACALLTTALALTQEMSLPGEQWQIQAALGDLYEMLGDKLQAQQAFAQAATIIQELAGRIHDEVLRLNFLATPQIEQVLGRAFSTSSLHDISSGKKYREKLFLIDRKEM